MPSRDHRCPPDCTCGLHRPRKLTDQHKARIGIAVKLTAEAKRHHA